MSTSRCALRVCVCVCKGGGTCARSRVALLAHCRPNVFTIDRFRVRFERMLGAWYSPAFVGQLIVHGCVRVFDHRQ